MTVVARSWDWMWCFYFLFKLFEVSAILKGMTLSCIFYHSELLWNLKLQLKIYLRERHWGKKISSQYTQSKWAGKLQSNLKPKQNLGCFFMEGIMYSKPVIVELSEKAFYSCELLTLNFTHLSILWVSCVTEVDNSSSVFRLLVLRKWAMIKI